LCVRFNQQPREEILRFLHNIVEKEGMQVDFTMLESILDLYSYDVRSMINHLQMQLGQACHRMLNQEDMQELEECWEDPQHWDQCLYKTSSLYNIEPRDIMCRYFDTVIRNKMRQSDTDIQQYVWLSKWRQRYEMLGTKLR
jgi:DNA polymerase III delta prime subunit